MPQYSHLTLNLMRYIRGLKSLCFLTFTKSMEYFLRAHYPTGFTSDLSFCNFVGTSVLSIRMASCRRNIYLFFSFPILKLFRFLTPLAQQFMPGTTHGGPRAIQMKH